MRLVLASRNAHKLGELARLLAPHELLPLPAAVTLPPELGETFAENALAKARAAAAATGQAVVADDSGIEAAALGGAPGVRSARYAREGAGDDENLAKLLREVPPDGDTRVAYVCALALVEPSGAPAAGGDPSRDPSGARERTTNHARERVVEGRCEGRLTHLPRGTGGFGYDPAFVPADRDDGCTMAELDPREKDAISHRGRAALALLALLPREDRL